MSSVVSLWVCSTVERLRSLLKSPWVWVETRCGPKLYFSFFPTEVVSALVILYKGYESGGEVTFTPPPERKNDPFCNRRRK